MKLAEPPQAVGSSSFAPEHWKLAQSAGQLPVAPALLTKSSVSKFVPVPHVVKERTPPVSAVAPKSSARRLDEMPLPKYWTKLPDAGSRQEFAP